MWTYKNRHYLITITADISLKEAIKIAGCVLESENGNFIAYNSCIIASRQIKKRFKELGYKAKYEVNPNWIRQR